MGTETITSSHDIFFLEHPINPYITMETPAIPLPKDERERRILDTLTVIRDKLLLLKRDRTKYIRTQDVMELYDQLVEQVKQLNHIRKGEHKAENRRTWSMSQRSSHPTIC